MPVYLPYFLLLIIFLLAYLICIAYIKTSNQVIKFVVANVISSFAAVLLTNTSLALFSENIEAGLGGGNSCSFILVCGQADVTAMNMTKGNNGLVDISIRMNGRKTFETSSHLKYDGFKSMDLADVHYSFSDFDLFVDVVVSTQSKKIVINGSNGQVTSH